MARSKRKRLTLRHESLWFKDGSIIIAAVGLSFKVHSGILERHSSVFKDLLNNPSQVVRTRGDTSEGCPVLHVKDVGKELARLLETFYDGVNR